MLYNTEKIPQKSKKTLIKRFVLVFALVVVFSASWVLASDITADTVINLVNNARAAINVAVLKKNDLLQKAAEEKAQDMIENNYFAHISPQGKSPWDWINKNNYNYKYAGENLAIGFANAKEQQQAWMDSPTHKKNILNENYDETGIAVKQGVIDGHEAIVVVQMFGKQMIGNISTSNISENPTDNANVVGTEMGKVAGASDKINLDVFLKNNSLTLIGWFTIFGIAIIIILIDLAALVHKKHEPFFLGNKKQSV